MIRGTRPDLYSRVPSRTALKQAMNPGPNRNVQSRTATRAWLMAGSAPATSWRRVTTASRLTTPVMMIAASSIRDMTRPSAMAWFCRFTTG